MSNKTKLYDAHCKASAKMVDFHGWLMPLHYGSQLAEHQAVRESAGIFDVSHMTIIDIKGRDTEAYLKRLLANDIGKLKQFGRGLYSCMLNEQGGILDDLIAYAIDEQWYRLVVNSATREKDLQWLQLQAKSFAIDLTERSDLAILAVQGPQAKDKLSTVFTDDQRSRALYLKSFDFVMNGSWFIARTGYTGEDGFEIMLSNDDVETVWQEFLAAGTVPCGLGARDTLRLEAGLCLYGVDMDETTTPYEANLAWTVALEPTTRDFIGRSALEQQKISGIKKYLVGLVLEEQGIPRSHQKVVLDDLAIVGEITSGTFSPTLKQGIALARLPMSGAVKCHVEIRDKLIAARIIKPPFVRFGEKKFK